MNTKFYLVEAKCGHVGRNYYVIKVIPVEAVSAKDASDIVRNQSRVKHDQKDAIINVKEVNEYDYELAYEKYNEDPYFDIHNRQDQKRYCYGLEENRIREKEIMNYIDDYEINKETKFCGRREKRKRIEKAYYLSLRNEYAAI